MHYELQIKLKFNFKIQQYQTDAVDAVVKVFAGQGFHDRIRYIRDLGKRTVPDVEQTEMKDTAEADLDDDTGYKNEEAAKYPQDTE